MARQQALSAESNFSKGFVTEVSPLNFPQNFCTETYDCVHQITGEVDRRVGFDVEINHSVKAIDRTDSVVVSYLWKDVAGNGNTSLVVLQVGSKLYFYNGSTTDPLSGHALTANIDLTTFSPSGAPSPKTEECQFTSGNGRLFVVNPFLEPFAVTFDPNTNTFSTTQITLNIRDFEGLDDGLTLDTRPTTSFSGLSVAHHYNLLNQGWNDTNLQAWDSARTDMPGNADVMARFKNASNAFDTTTIANMIQYTGNSPAPKGHYILNVVNKDRGAASGLSINPVTTDYQRPSAVAFYSGRLFYSGINYVNNNSKIFFSQIIERDSQFGQCYQANDPTSDEEFDLLASDGGVIDIQDAGTIIKLISLPGGLFVFASNGIWQVSGSTGLGFKADDYSVTKISSITALTHTSFVDLAGIPFWWNLEGIYRLDTTQGAYQVSSITDSTIKRYYNTIPPSEKRNARGFFNQLAARVQWVFRSTEASDLNEYYEYDRILNLDIRTGGLYVWTIPEHSVKLHGMVVLENRGGTVSLENVTANDTTTVTTGAGNVQVWTIGNSIVTPVFKYVISYDSSGDQFTFAETRNSNNYDWEEYGDPVGYDSYFLSGYKLSGNGMNYFQDNFVTFYTDNASKFKFKGVWDFTTHTSDATSRMSVPQLIDTTSGFSTYDTVSRRLKLRGHGRALQFKISSVDNNPFNVKGWSALVSVNSTP